MIETVLTEVPIEDVLLCRNWLRLPRTLTTGLLFLLTLITAFATGRLEYFCAAEFMGALRDGNSEETLTRLHR
jgi:hypothetical protein